MGTVRAVAAPSRGVDAHGDVRDVLVVGERDGRVGSRLGLGRRLRGDERVEHVASLLLRLRRRRGGWGGLRGGLRGCFAAAAAAAVVRAPSGFERVHLASELGHLAGEGGHLAEDDVQALVLGATRAGEGGGELPLVRGVVRGGGAGANRDASAFGSNAGATRGGDRADGEGSGGARGRAEGDGSRRGDARGDARQRGRRPRRRDAAEGEHEPRGDDRGPRTADHRLVPGRARMKVPARGGDDGCRVDGARDVSRASEAVERRADPRGRAGDDGRLARTLTGARAECASVGGMRRLSYRGARGRGSELDSGRKFFFAASSVWQVLAAKRPSAVFLGDCDTFTVTLLFHRQTVRKSTHTSRPRPRDRCFFSGRRFVLRVPFVRLARRASSRRHSPRRPARAVSSK